MSITPEMMEKARKKGAPGLDWKNFGTLGCIPKKAIKEFMAAHPMCAFLEAKEGRYTMSIIAIPLGPILESSKEEPQA